MKRHLKYIVYILIIFISILLSSITGIAVEPNYTVSPIFDKTHQEDGNFDYFRLKYKKDGSGKIGVRITNNTSETMRYKITFNRGNNGPSGTIIYDKNANNQANGTDDIAGLVDIPDEVSVDPNSSKDVIGKFKMPSDEIKGTLVGGIIVSEVGDESGDGVKMSVDYTFPVIFVGKTSPPTQNDFKVSDFSLKENSSEVVSNIHASYKYTNDTYLRTKETSIKLIKGENVAFSRDLDEYIIIQDSTVPLLIDVNESLDTGRYKLEVSITDYDNKVYTLNKTVYIGDVTSTRELVLYGVIGTFVTVLITYVIAKKFPPTEEDEFIKDDK